MGNKKTRKIALVGTAPSAAFAPIDDPSYEIWGVGFRGEHITRCTRWFEIHRLDSLHDGPEWRPLLRKWAKDCELVMFWPETLGPKVMQYPVEEIKNRFGTYFMTSSLSWMMALAIHENDHGRPVSEIGIWGVDMEFGVEYREQRFGLRHFLEMAKVAGITTKLLTNSGIVYEPVPYPFWQDDPLTTKLKLRREGVQGKIAEDKRVIEVSVSRIGQINAVIEELLKIKSIDEKYRRPRIEKLTKEGEALKRTLPTTQQHLAYHEGALEEIEWQEDYLKP